MSLPFSGDSAKSTRTNASFSLTFSLASARHIASGSFPSGSAFVWKVTFSEVTTSSLTALTRAKRASRSSAAIMQSPAIRTVHVISILFILFSLPISW